MGTGNSKNAPDEQMRKKMENGFDEDDDDDIDGLGIPPEREKNINPRSKSNISIHNERFQNSSADGDEYFNQIYNKSSEKPSLQSSLSVGGGSFGTKSAPPGPKKEKDAEVAAAIAELEETFKVLGTEVPAQPPRQPLPSLEQSRSKVMEDGGKGGTEFGSHEDELDNGYSDSLSMGGEDLPLTPPSSQNTEVMSDESGMDSQSSESPPCQQIQYNRQLISRAGPGPGKLLEMNGRGIPSTSSGFSRSNLFSSSGPSMPSSSRGLLVSSHNINKNGRNSSNVLSKSVLMQQRQDFQQKKLVTEQQHLRTETIDENEAGKTKKEDWTYEPPKIQGFDVEKFKEVNSKTQTSTIVPMILREEEDNGYCSRSPDIPAYTKDELALIASLEREVY